MTEAHPRSTSLTLSLILFLVILIGLTLRTWNVQFDRGIGSHPDERSTACFYAPTIQWPHSWEEFKDPHRSPLNPLWDLQNDRRRSFTYGHFPLYLGVLTGEVLHRVAPVGKILPLSDRVVRRMAAANTACAGVTVAGRLVIALLDTLTILLLFLLGRRIYGPGAGLLAATFYAFTAQAVQLSHFFAMDPASTTFTVLAVLGGVQMVQERSWRSVVVTGVGVGLAVSSKFSALPIVAAPVVAAAIVLGRSQRDPADGRGAFRMLLGAPLALALAFVVFFVTSPYAVLDWKNFVQATLVEQGQMVRGLADMPFTRQYRNTTPYLYFIQQQVRWGLGWPLGVIALAGTVWALVKAGALRARAGELIVWSWLLPYFGLTGAFLAKFNRYMSPVLPFALLFAGGLIATLWGFSTRRREEETGRQGDRETGRQGDKETGRQGDEETESPVPPSSPPPLPPSPHPLTRALAVLLAVIGIGGGLFWSLAYVNGVYGHEHTWIASSRWVYEKAPPGSVILWELWDDPLPKAIPDEPGMDMGSRGLRHIDWSPYEEDTAEKYAILKQKLREADYVIYSSKRIYDSVDELPERYPMTIRYYRLMFDEQLGFRHVADFTSPPRLFGLTFPDQNADESWSLYDHPRVSIFQKERDLSDAEFDALLGGSWEGAVAWYRGPDSPLSPLLDALGLGSSPESQDRGLINRVIALLNGENAPSPLPDPETRKDLSLDKPLRALPLVDNFRWNPVASTNPWLAVLWWWFVVSLLGWLAWPIGFVIFRRLRDRGYLFTKTLGWLLAGWLLWLFSSLGLAANTVTNSWLTVALLAVLGGLALVWSWPQWGPFLRRMWPLLLVGEALFAGAFLLFVAIRMGNPDIWQPWFGGEKFMEFAFLNGILRSPTFPPVDPHFAGGYINYYYYGIYLVGFLVKLTGIYAEVAFNLAVPTLFALTVINAFGVAYGAVRGEERGSRGAGEPGSRGAGGRGVPAWGAVGADVSVGMVEEDGVEPAPLASPQFSAEVLDIDLAAPTTPSPRHLVTPSPHHPLTWSDGLAWSLLAPLFVALIGNLDSFAQIVRHLVELSQSDFTSAIPAVQTAVRAFSGLERLLTTDVQLPGYDFWAPSRVIPFTINEFPYWSFTYADLHPHMIGIPFAVFFLGLILALLHSYDVDWRRQWRYGLLLLGALALVLGVLANINLWELPTYYGLGVLALAVTLYRGRGRIDWPVLIGFAVLYLAGAYLLFYPFFRDYENVAASGVGLVRPPDALGVWLLIWGFFAFVLVSWLWVSVRAPGRPGDARPTGLERALSLAARRFDRLPRFLHLQGLLVQRPGVGFLAGQGLVPLLLAVTLLLLLFTERTVLALCLPFLGLGFLLLWRRGRAGDPGALLAALLTATGFAILAGTQVIYLKDFLQGGDWRRMNTLFKFFIQVWVLWSVAAAIAVPRILEGKWRVAGGGEQAADGPDTHHAPRTTLRPAWTAAFALLLLASFAYPLWGTAARLDQRFPGWRPEIGTLNGLDYMRQGVYYWPDGDHPIELHYDWEAIQWLLEHVRGNLVIAESAQLDYYRAGGTRVASLTGLSGVSGMHEGEQRYGDVVGERNGLLNELWSTTDRERTQALMDQLDVALIYVGQLERQLHPAAVEKFARMAEEGLLTVMYENEKVTIYAVPSRVRQMADGVYIPAQG